MARVYLTRNIRFMSLQNDGYQRGAQVFQFVQEAAYCCETLQISRTCKSTKTRQKSVDGCSDIDRPKIGVCVVLENIVAQARSKGYQIPEPIDLPTSRGHNDVPIKSLPRLSKMLQYIQQGKSGYAEEVRQKMDFEGPLNLQKFKGKLSMQDALHILDTLEDKTLAFTFYEWIKQQPNYIAEHCIFAAVIDCLITCIKSKSTWENLKIVLEDMFLEKMYPLNSQFQRLLESTPYNAAKVPRFENWFKRMKELGFVPHFSTYEKLMRMCNMTGMHETSLSFFKEIPLNRYSWSYSSALSACGGTGDLDMAEGLWKEMKLLGIERNAKCFSILFSLYVDRRDTVKAERLLQEVENEGIVNYLHACTSAIHTYARAGMVQQAELLFQNLSSRGGLDPGVYRAMSACYGEAGLFKDLLELIKRAKHNQVKIGTEFYNSAIQTCLRKSQWEFAADIFTAMQDCGLSPSPQVYCTMLQAFLKAKQYHYCENIFFHMVQIQVLLPKAFEIIIHMYKSTERYSRAIDAFKLMKGSQCTPTSGIFEQILPLVIKTSLLDARDLYYDMRSAGLQPSLNMYNMLISEHIKVGDLSQTRQFYDEMLAAGLQASEEIILITSGCKEEGENGKTLESIPICSPNE